MHRPKQADPDDRGQWVDGNGDPLPDNPNVFHYTAGPRYGLAQINHYALGAMESFLVKIARGKPNHSGDPIDLAYWSDRNFAEVEDTRILRHQSQVAARVANMMADPEVSRLHFASIAWRKTRIAALLQTAESFDLVARLQQMPPTRVLDMAAQNALLRGLMRIKAAEHARATK